MTHPDFTYICVDRFVLLTLQRQTVYRCLSLLTLMVFTFPVCQLLISVLAFLYSCVKGLHHESVSPHVTIRLCFLLQPPDAGGDFWEWRQHEAGRRRSRLSSHSEQQGHLVCSPLTVTTVPYLLMSRLRMMILCITKWILSTEQIWLLLISFIQQKYRLRT